MPLRERKPIAKAYLSEEEKKAFKIKLIMDGLTEQEFIHNKVVEYLNQDKEKR